MNYFKAFFFSVILLSFISLHVENAFAVDYCTSESGASYVGSTDNSCGGSCYPGTCGCSSLTPCDAGTACTLLGDPPTAYCTEGATCQQSYALARVNIDLNNDGVNNGSDCTTIGTTEYCLNGESPVSGITVTERKCANFLCTSYANTNVTTDSFGHASFYETGGYYNATYTSGTLPGFTVSPASIDGSSLPQFACGAQFIDFLLTDDKLTGLGPQNGTHTGRVFIDNDSDGAFLPNEPFTDSNGNGVWDRTCTAFFIVCWSWSEEPYTDQNGNGTYDNGPDALYTARPYIYLTNPNNGQQISARANSQGTYSIQRFSSNYSLRLGVPSGYTANTANPVSIVSGNPQVVDFGIIGAAPTICPSGDLTANPTSIYAGDTSDLSLINCITPTPAGPTPTPNPLITPITVNWQPPACGTMPNPNTGNLTNVFTAPPAVGICAPQTCRVEAEVTDGTQTSLFSEDITVRNRDVVQGTVYQDLNNDNCTTLSPDSGTAVELWEGVGGTQLDTDTTTGTGTYSLINEQAVCSDLNIILPGKTLKRARVNGGAWAPESGSDYNLTLSSNPQTVDFCIGSITPWYQVTTGDVRFYDLINPAPLDNVAALGNATGNFPGIFISSDYLDLNGKTASAQNWKVANEYSYNSNFRAGKGALAYEFYMAKSKELGVDINELPTTTPDLTTLPAGIYRLEKGIGDLSISNPMTITGGKHIILLVEGDVTINSTISVPSGLNNLFVLAAKGDITITSNVGNTTLADGTTTQLDGYYSSEGSIKILSSANCSSGVEDRRLVVGGALIANALNPFAQGQSGVISNERTLCSFDTTIPTLKVITRADFLTQMTDFYKTANKTFREIEP